MDNAGAMLNKLYGIIMGIAMIIFAIFWTVTASSMGAPGFFSFFGVIFVIIAVVFLLKTMFGPSR
jgi:hypothetical protein